MPAGIPTDLLDSYPVLKEFRNSIATLPEVAAFYRWVTCYVLASTLEKGLSSSHNGQLLHACFTPVQQ